MVLTWASDNEFIEKLTGIVLANLDNQNLGVRDMERESGLSRTTLNHRLRSISQKTINEFIRETRLRKARELLINETVTAAEVAYRVGFSSPAYFSTCFSKHFGYPPGEAKRKNAEKVSEISLSVPDSTNQEGNLKPEDPGKIKRWQHFFIRFFFGILILILLSFLFTKGYSGFLKNGNKFLSISKEKSIAILPFKNIADSTDNQYYAYGVMEEIHTSLSQIGDLKVVSRTSVEQFRNSSKTIREIAGILGVNYVLEGSVQKSNDMVRVKVRLLDAGHERELYSQTFDKKLTDIFDVQSNIARSVASELRSAMSEEEIRMIEKVPTQKTEAYTNYLKGRYFNNSGNDEGINKSIVFFERAIASDPNYAPAYAGLAEAYFIKTWWGNFNRSEGYDKAKTFALQALNLDKNLAEAHAILGRIYCYYDWKWEEAENEFVHAIDLNPNYSTAYFYYSEFLDITGQQYRAINMINRAIELDPLSNNLYSLASLFYYNLGDFKKSLECCDKVIEMDPEYSIAYWRYFRIYFFEKNEKKALDALQKVLAIDSATARYSTDMLQVYNKSGINGILEWLIKLKLERSGSVNIARFYAMLDKKKEALDYLEQAMEEHAPNFCRIMSYYDLKNLRTEKKYDELLKKAGLTSYFNKIASSGNSSN